MTAEEFIAYISDGKEIDCRSDIQTFMNDAADGARRITARINGAYLPMEQIAALFDELTCGGAGEGFRLFPPFYTDFGKNIKTGKNVFINSGCCFQDQGGIVIGDGCLIGHQVVIATLNHSVRPESRGNMTAKPVRLGKNVWVGSHATILPGVTIGDGAIIAAGAVVSRDIPSNAIAAGVPARVIRFTDENGYGK